MGAHYILQNTLFRITKSFQLLELDSLKCLKKCNTLDGGRKMTSREEGEKS